MLLLSLAAPPRAGDPCSAQNPAPSPSQGPDSPEQDHFTPPAGSPAMAAQHICVLANHHNAQVPFIDLLLLFDYCHRLLQPESGTLHSLFLPFPSSRWFHPLPSCLSNLQILDFPSFGRSLRNIGTDQAKALQLSSKNEHGMDPSSMGWKWEKKTPLWLLGQPGSQLGKVQVVKGSQLTPSSVPTALLGSPELLPELQSWLPAAAPGLCGWDSGPAPPAAFPHHSWVKMHGVPLHSPKPTEITDVSYCTALQLPLRAPSTPSVSQFSPQSPRKWSFVELIQWNHSCNASHSLPAFRTAPSLHRCTAMTCAKGKCCFLHLKWVWYSQYEKNPPPLHELFAKAVLCEVCTAFVLCYILSSPSYQWILSILKTFLAQVLALDTNGSFWKWLEHNGCCSVPLVTALCIWGTLSVNKGIFIFRVHGPNTPEGLNQLTIEETRKSPMLF